MKLLKKIFTPPAFPGEEDKTIVAQSLYTLLLAALGASGLAFGAFAILAPASLTRVMGTLLPVVLVLIASWVWVRRGHVRLAAWLVIGVAWVASTLSTVLTGGIRTNLFGVSWMVVLVLSGFLIGRRAVFGIGLINLVTGIALVWADAQGWIPPVPTSISPVSILISYAINLLAAIAGMYIAIRSLQSALDRARQDLAQRATAEQKLRQSEERLRLTLDAARVGTWEWDLTTNAIHWSDNVEPMFGVALGTFHGSPDEYWALIHPADRPALQKAVNDAVAGKLGNYHVEHRVQLPAGEMRWLEGNGRIDRDASGKPIRMIGTVSDITARKQTEEAFRESEAKFRMIVEESSEGILLCDETGRIIEWNRAFEKLTGLSRAQVMGTPMWDTQFRVLSPSHQTPERLEQLEKSILASLKTGESPIFYRSLEATIVTPDGTERHIMQNAFPIKTEQGFRVASIVQDTTERKRADQAVRESEQFLRQIIDLVPHLIFAKDHKSRFILANKTLADLHGISPTEVVGKTSEDISQNKSEASRFRSDDLMVIQRNTVAVVPEEQVTDAQGQVHYFQTTKIPFRFGPDNKPGLIGVGIEITERKKAEAQIQQRLHELATINAISRVAASQLELNALTKTVSENLRQVFDIHGIHIAILDQEKNLIRFPYWWALGQEKPIEPLPLGKGLTSIVIQSATPLLISQDYEKRFAALGGRRTTIPGNKSPLSWLGVPMFAGEQVIGAISIQNFEREFAFSEEDVRLLVTIAANLGMAIQNAQLYTAAQQEIAERKLAEQALRESQALYQSLVSVLPMSLCRKDLQGRITFANQRFCDEFHATLEKLIGKTDFDLHPPELAEQYRRDDRTVIETGESIELVEVHAPIDGETTHVQVFKSPVRDARGKIIGVQVMFWDITERKLAEQEREKLIAELETKNAELERFTYTVSHDLKSPLITIRGFLGFMEQDVRTGNTDRLAHDMARIVSATNKMQQLLSDLLELSRIGRLMNPPEDVPFNDIVNEAIELVRGRLTAKNIRLVIAENLPVVHGDRARLIEVVQNLVDNAAKFTSNQTQPTIEIGMRGADTHGNPIFFVRDNGIGIDPKYHDRVFGLFNKLDVHSEGTGIGLALVKRIVQVHGGKIWIESEGLGKGTTFCFTLAT